MRFAVCVCGDVRGFANLAWAFEARLLKPTTAAGSTVDIFAHIWMDGSRLEREGEEVLRRRIGGVIGLVVEPTEQRQNLTASSYGWPPSRRMHASGSFEAFRSQWRKVTLCLHMAFAHAMLQRPATTMSYYDAYVRTRCDMLHLVPHDLGREHSAMSARAQSLTGRAEYVAMQACLAPRPSPVSDAWLVATPGAARFLAALPRPDEPECCERWLSHRLQNSMRIFDAGDAKGKHWRSSPAVCGGRTKLHALQSRGDMPFFTGRLHAVHLGARCVKRKQHLASHRSCRRTVTEATNLDVTLAAQITAQPLAGADPAAEAATDTDDEGTKAVAQLLALPATSANATVIKHLGIRQLLLRSACRCPHGAARARASGDLSKFADD